MRIAICDDSPADLAQIGAYVAEYVEKRHLVMDVVRFSSPEALLSFERQHGAGDVYLLDIVMDGMSGIDLAHRIRERTRRAFILYLTGEESFSLDAFSVRAFSYLIKPVSREKLFSELDECFERLSPPQKPPERIAIRTPEGLQTAVLNDINAVEYVDHRLIYHLTHGRRIAGVSQKRPFESQAEELTGTGHFVRSARGYYVNMKNVRSMTASGFIMADGSEFPITRKFTHARGAFLDFAMR